MISLFEARFREAMNKYSNLVDELSDSRQGHESVLLSAVEHVVEKAVKEATSNIPQLIEDRVWESEIVSCNTVPSSSLKML